MRFFLMVLAACLAVDRSQGVPHAVNYTTHLNGESYLRLADWAAGQGLELRWLKRDETIQLSNGSSRLLLRVDSREAQWDGVAVWLSFPVLMRNGSLFLSRIDAETAIQPLISHPRSRAGVEIKRICLDPGHGGKDPGYCVGPNQEKKYTLLLAEELRRQLTGSGFKVTLTRTTDRFVELPERPELANRRNADLFLSIHFNATEIGRASVQGAQVFCLTPAGASSTNTRGEGGGAGWFTGNRNNDKNLFLAYAVQKQLIHSGGVEDRGIRRARFAVLRDAAMPAVLIEAGFMSHPVEGRKIFSAGYRHQLAQAIADGIKAYKKTAER